MMNHEDKSFMLNEKTPLEYSYLRDMILGGVEITGSIWGFFWPGMA